MSVAPDRTAVERQRRHRERRRKGLRVVRVPISAEAIEHWLNVGLLESMDDHERIVEVASAIIEAHALTWTD